MISTKELEYRRRESALLSIKIINGSSKFQFVVFTPDSKQIKAAPRLFIFDSCPVNYGACDCFTSHDMSILYLNKTVLRSSTKLDNSNNENTDETVVQKSGTKVALAADSSSIDTVWFVKVVKVCLSQEDAKDDCGHTIRASHEHIHGHFLEKVSTSTDHL